MVGGLLDVAALDLGSGADLWFSLEYVREGGIRRREPLAACASERFEEAAPVRSFRCYELHIGFTHLGWNIWTGNQADLAVTARRLAEILDRGPLPL
jgi:hypothetical protein